MTTSGVITQPAPAKINLSLHVVGQRADGYHLLDSLVMFTSLGDEITVDHADTLSLTIEGPFADGLTNGDDNLVGVLHGRSPSTFVYSHVAYLNSIYGLHRPAEMN